MHERSRPALARSALAQPSLAQPSLPQLSFELGPDTPGVILAPRLAQFAAVARLEHITRAAEELGMPQPTLSRAIARLEAELGSPCWPGRAARCG